MKKVIQYDISRGRIPRPETVFRHVQILKKYGLTGVLLYIECFVDNNRILIYGGGIMKTFLLRSSQMENISCLQLF